MNKIKGLISVVMLCVISNTVVAQQIGTIGIADSHYNAEQTEHFSPEELKGALERRINATLQSTRKFMILEYRQLRERLKEQNLSLDNYYSKEYQDSGKYDKVGVDYVLTAKIENLDVKHNVVDGKKTSSASVTIGYKTIGLEHLTEDSNSVTITKISEIADDERAISQSLLSDAFEESVAKYFKRLIADVFPVRVLSIRKNGVVTLNYGEGILSHGDKISVFPKNSKITLDESGEVIGQPIASLKVVDATRRFSKAEIVSGKDVLEVGQLGSY